MKQPWESFLIDQKHLILLIITYFCTNSEHYGFRGIVLDWFKNYLSNRKQFVSFDTSESEQKNIVCGVPQGSILGPLLFSLYVNVITNTSDVLDFILFPDDTTIPYSHSNIEKK